MTREFQFGEELQIALEDIESVESKNEDLKQNVKVANECLQKLREQILKFRLRHKEVNNQLKLVNETIKDLMQKIEEKNKIEETLKESIKLKTEECEKLEQELNKLKAKNKVLDSSQILEELMNMQKAHLDKTRLGFQLGEISNKDDKDKRKEVKEEAKKKLEDAKKTQNQCTNARRLLIRQSNAQRYQS